MSFYKNTAIFSAIVSYWQKKWFKRSLIALVALMTIFFIWKFTSQLLGLDDPEFRTVKIEEGPLTVTISASGTLNPVKSVQVGTQVSGMVSDIYVDFNDVVKKGQVIARIDPREWQARFEQAEANYILARRNHENNKKLIEKNFVSPAAFDQTLSAYKSAKAAMDMAKKALDDTVIRAPVDGVVVKRSVERGQTVAASLQAPELFIIAQNLADMQVETAIDESDVGRITEGMNATFTVDAFPGRVFQSKVKQIRKAPINVQNVITYTVLLTAENQDLKLLPGMTANTNIITEKKDQVVKVANAALRFKMPDDIAKQMGVATSSPSVQANAPGAAAGSNAGRAAGSQTGPRKPYGAGAQRVMTRKVWVLEEKGLGKKPAQKTIRVGLTDGGMTEILPVDADNATNNSATQIDTLKPGTEVIVGIVGLTPAPATRPTGPRLF
ncbi:efflux RND transporter periplasmic adaptor subunit [Polynucleobacter sp. MWH-Loch1C5]|uniref:efflux RND transporter periplasmic adaptor subunit n=1 Tax=Polynucleobacter sp. MWH-Loch1C5 TaxID=2689108 RepID=UPI001C0B6C63|nr:efflux RND transporter periplasmic adaptor subunit [Polynucleobacter sp. MWH-Loch1C5]MBU3542190.1 efflux RND transporter periplasmic adaptor subunit [Polynucleobacter sp. MWH-Loch1C5]